MDKDLAKQSTTGASLETSWMERARCRELPAEVFFPSDGVGVEVARRHCAECVVRGPCLEYALVHRIEHGVWGGASERERRRINRGRRSLAYTGPAMALPPQGDDRPQQDER
jgi:WhiB family redox-sensing transcriptional regulator